MFDISQITQNIFGNRNFLKNEKVKEHELEMKLIQTIIGSLDPEELKNKIVKEIAIALDAYRCLFIEYDFSTNNFQENY